MARPIRIISVFMLWLLLFLPQSLSAQTIKEQSFTPSVAAAWGFLENKGQLADENGKLLPEIKYYGHSRNVHVYCKPGMISFVFTSSVPSNAKTKADVAPWNPLAGSKRDSLKHSPTNLVINRAEFQLVASNPRALIAASDQKGDYYENDYIDHRPEAGVSNIYVYNTITYKSIYPHIDMVLHTRENGMKYDFIVYPGGKVSDIQMHWYGLDAIKNLENGGIRYSLPLGKMEESAPVSFQGQNRIKTIFTMSPVRSQPGNIGFKVEKYTETDTLRIDPLLSWGTYLGGSDYDQSHGVCHDKAGNVYISGYSNSTSGIATSGAYQTAIAGYTDFFIAKFDSKGNIKWSTYFGGGGDDWGYGLAIDGTDKLYITGETWSWYNSYKGLSDVLVVAVSKNGYVLGSAVYGGSGGQRGHAIAVDSHDNVYVTGITSSKNGIATSGAYKTSLTGTNNAFLAKFNSSLGLQWGTYFGGNTWEEANAITCDHSDNVLIDGYTLSTSGVVTSGGYQTSFGGATEDGFLAKFDGNGNIKWATYYGGSGDDGADGVVTDGQDNIYITGGTGSKSGIATSGSFQSSLLGSSDAFLAKFDSAGSRIWATYFGGTNNEYGSCIAKDTLGNLYVSGATYSKSGVATSGAYQTSLLGLDDLFLAQFTNNGKLLQATYYGGSGDQIAYAITSDGPGAIYLTGVTASSASIATSGAYQTSFSGGNWDAFLAKFSFLRIDAGINAILPKGTFCANNSDFKVRLKNFGTDTLRNVDILSTVNNVKQKTYNWSGKLDPDSSVIVTIEKFNFTPGKYTVRAWTSKPNGITDSVKSNDSAMVLDTVNSIPTPHAGPGKTICAGATIPIGADSTAKGITYSWTSFPSGFTSSLARDTVSPLNSITYYLTETFTKTGCSNTDTLKVKVNPKPTAKAIANSSICPGASVAIGASAVPGSKYKWTSSPSGFTATSSNPKVSPLTNTVYYLTEIDTITGCTNSDTLSIKINPVPVASFSVNNTSECFTGNNFKFNDNSILSSGKLAYWKYDFGDSTSDYNSISSNSYAKPGSYNVVYTVKSDKGCQAAVSKTITVYPDAKAAFSINDSSQCISGNHFIFSDKSVAGSLNNWNWNFGDKAISAVQNPDHVFLNPGVYKVRLKISGGGGCADSAVKSVSVHQTLADFSVKTISQCLESNSFNFTDNSISDDSINLRKWNFGDGKSSISKNPFHHYSLAGNDSVQLTVTSKNGCVSSVAKSLAVYGPPTADFAINSSTQCLNNNSFVFTDLSSTATGSLAAWRWNFGDGAISSFQNTAYTYNNKGNYKVWLYLETNKGCKDSTYKIVAVHEPFFPTVTGPLTACNLSAAVYKASTDSAGGKYTWNIKGGTIQTGKDSGTVLVKWLNPGFETITAIYTNKYGCSGAQTNTIRINQADKPLITGPGSICGAGTASYATALVSNDTYMWKINGGSITSGNTTSNITAALNALGAYTLTVYQTTGLGCRDSAALAINVWPRPVAANNFKNGCEGDTILFKDSSSGADNYLWDFSDQATTTLRSPSHVFESAGRKSIREIVKSNNGCVDTLKKNIDINPLPNVYMNIRRDTGRTIHAEATDTSNIITWDFGDGNVSARAKEAHYYSRNGTYTVELAEINKYGCRAKADSVLDIDYTCTNENVEISPNPFESELNIEYTICSDAHVRVYIWNMLGQQVNHLDVMQKSGDYTYKFSDFVSPASGIYCVKVMLNDKTITKKVVKIR